MYKGPGAGGVGIIGGGGALAYTGVGVVWLIAVAAVLIVLGTSLLVATRRRKARLGQQAGH